MRVRALFFAALLAALRARGSRNSCCLFKDACEAHVLKQALTASMSCAVLAIDSEYANRVHFRREGERRVSRSGGGHLSTLAIDSEYTNRVHFRLKQRMSRSPPRHAPTPAPSTRCHALSWRLIVSIQIECTSVLSPPAAPQVSVFLLLYYFVLVKQVN